MHMVKVSLLSTLKGCHKDDNLGRLIHSIFGSAIKPPVGLDLEGIQKVVGELGRAQIILS